MKVRDARSGGERSSPRPILSAPTQRSLYRYRNRAEPDDVVRRVRLRVDETDAAYPPSTREVDFAFVNLLQRPREGQPIVWVRRGKRVLTVYGSETNSGGVAFVVTGLVYASAP